MSGIFISYRRSTSKHLARSIFMALQQRGHDVFLDVNSIDAGAFDGIIRNQIKARPHFLLILSTGALERCANEKDWLRLEIEEAFRLNRNIVPIYDEGFDLNREIRYLPEPIRSELPLKNAPPFVHYYFDAFIQTLSDRFFKDAVDNVPVTPTPAAEQAEVQKRIAQATQPNDGWTPQLETTDTPQPVSPEKQAELNAFMRRAAEFKHELVPPTPSHPQMWGVENILPQPFEWVYIPPGIVTIELNLDSLQTYSVNAFNISKYPITNAQFEVFAQSEDGYHNPQWWEDTLDAREWHENNKSPQPRAFHEDNHPRTNVSYYEALAFCNWLMARFNTPSPELPPTKITLPAIQQWFRAAFGDDTRKFPWGNEFRVEYCNTKESGIGRTTPVTKYQVGASNYGVVDLIGNVWEQCTSDNLVPQANRKLGGSFASSIRNITELSTTELKRAQNNQTGFRIVLMNS